MKYNINIRGRLGSLTASSLALGIRMTYIMSAVLSSGTSLLGSLVVCMLVTFLLGTLFLPESPSWLLANGGDHEARQSLQRLRGKKIT